MKILVCIAITFAVSQALTPPPITGTTPPPVYCPDSLCHGHYDGNFKYVDPKSNYYDPHYFVQCSGGLASCQACWPLILEFSPRCNQCLYKKDDPCFTTEKWEPATTYYCPDACPSKGYDFSGNIVDPKNPRQYVACWQGVTVGCVACPGELKFNEEWNACLYEGKYKTAPTYTK